MIENREIQKILPHRYPFLLVDRLIHIAPGQKGVGLKNLTGEEWFFRDHNFYPPVLLLESLAQVGGIVLATKIREEDPSAKFIGLFAGISDFHFWRWATIGEQIILQVELIQSLANIYRFHAEAFVGDQKIAGGQILLSFSPASRESPGQTAPLK